MKPVLNNAGGKCVAYPDVCKTPSPGGPVPIPYPNIAQDGDGNGASKVKIENKKVLRKGDKIRMSMGDEAGTLGGVVSSRFKSTGELKTGCSTVKAQGRDVAYLFVPVGQNGGTQNTQGAAAVPGQVKVIIVKINGKQENAVDKVKAYVDNGEEVTPNQKTKDAARERGNATDKQDKINASENLGEEGSLNAVRSHLAGKFGGLKSLFVGRGSGVFDIVAECGNAFLIIEAKGGGSGRGFRKVGGRYYRQGTRGYRDAIIKNMQKSRDPATKAMGQKLKRARNIKYYHVRTRQKKGKARPTRVKEFDPIPLAFAEVENY